VTRELEQILAYEQRFHPELSPSGLVTMLVRRGHQVVSERPRRELVEALAGGVHYPDSHRGALSDEWAS
jgi:hypothetical protein